MRNLVAGLMILGCVGSFVGCGVEDPTIDEQEGDQQVQSQEPQTSQHTAAVTTHNGYCNLVKIGTSWRHVAQCKDTNDPVTMCWVAPSTTCPSTGFAINRGPAGSCLNVDLALPCSYTTP